MIKSNIIIQQQGLNNILIQAKIASIFKSELAFNTNITDISNQTRFICDHVEQNLQWDNSCETNQCNYRSNDLWDIELHKKIFHVDPQNELDQKEKSFGLFDFKPTINTSGRNLPSIKEFQESTTFAQVFHKIKSTNHQAKKRHLKQLSKRVLKTAKVSRTDISQVIEDITQASQQPISTNKIGHQKSYNNLYDHASNFQSKKFDARSQLLPLVQKFNYQQNQLLSKSPPLTYINNSEAEASQIQKALQFKSDIIRSLDQLLKFSQIQNQLNNNPQRQQSKQQNLPQQQVEPNPVCNSTNPQINITGDKPSSGNQILRSMLTQHISKMPYQPTKATEQQVQDSLTPLNHQFNKLYQNQSNVNLQTWLNDIECSSYSESPERPNEDDHLQQKKTLRRFSQIQSRSINQDRSRKNLQVISDLTRPSFENTNKMLKPKAHKSSLQLKQVQQYFELEISCQKMNKNQTNEVVCPFKGCNKTFRHRSLMTLHASTHTGDKPFKCQFCDKSFITKGNKKDHERRHLNLKLFKCDHCQQQFYRSNQLKKHQLQCSRNMRKMSRERELDTPATSILEFKNEDNIMQSVQTVRKDSIRKDSNRFNQ